LVYAPVPERYFTPSSPLLLHEVSAGIVRATVGLEGYVPRTVDRCHRRLHDLRDSTSGGLHGPSEDGEDRTPWLKVQRNGRAAIRDAVRSRLDFAGVSRPEFCLPSVDSKHISGSLSREGRPSMLRGKASLGGPKGTRCLLTNGRR
jgi:hypothetical protein